MPERHLWDLIASILAGFSVLHDRLILHRDVKPANVFSKKVRSRRTSPCIERLLKILAALVLQRNTCSSCLARRPANGPNAVDKSERLMAETDHHLEDISFTWYSGERAGKSVFLACAADSSALFRLTLRIQVSRLVPRILSSRDCDSHSGYRFQDVRSDALLVRQWDTCALVWRITPKATLSHISWFTRLAASTHANHKKQGHTNEKANGAAVRNAASRNHLTTATRRFRGKPSTP